MFSNSKFSGKLKKIKKLSGWVPRADVMIKPYKGNLSKARAKLKYDAFVDLTDF